MGKSVIKRTGHPVDLYVGERIRAAREMRKVSQTKLADAMGITFQQIQKYERGRNRVSVSALVMISNTLQLNPGWFFKGAPGVETLNGRNPVAVSTKFFASRGGVELADRFLAMNPRDRHAVVSLAQTLTG